MRVKVESSYFHNTDVMLKEYGWLKKYNLEDPDKDKKDLFFKDIRDVYITVNSLEDLIDIIRKSENPIILATELNRKTKEEEWVLEIYDGFRE